jgi:hypothetical protein
LTSFQNSQGVRRNPKVSRLVRMIVHTSTSSEVGSRKPKDPLSDIRK